MGYSSTIDFLLWNVELTSELNYERTNIFLYKS